jgi:hypothetical protein
MRTESSWLTTGFGGGTGAASTGAAGGDSWRDVSVVTLVTVGGVGREPTFVVRSRWRLTA